MIEETIRNNPTTFVIMRSGEQVGEATGFNDITDQVIYVRPGVQASEGDWLVDKDSEVKFFVKKAGPLRDDGQPIGVQVFYETRIDYERQASAAQVSAMLNDIADAIWILSEEKMPAEDKREARAAVKVLQAALTRMPPGAAEGLAQ
jgi:hypothetical protein